MTDITLRNFKARAERQILSDVISIYLFERLPSGQVSVMTDLIFDTVDVGLAPARIRGIELPVDVAQQLVDALWDCGLRPSEGTGSAGALRATENHLKDMQSLTNRLLSLVERHSG